MRESVHDIWLCTVVTMLLDGVIKWKHSPCYWPFVRGIHRSPVPLQKASDVELQCHRGHYDASVMCIQNGLGVNWLILSLLQLLCLRIACTWPAKMVAHVLEITCNLTASKLKFKLYSKYWNCWVITRLYNENIDNKARSQSKLISWRMERCVMLNRCVFFNNIPIWYIFKHGKGKHSRKLLSIYLPGPILRWNWYFV